MLVCLHLATTIPCTQVVWHDWPGMLQSHESWLEMQITITREIIKY